MNAAEAVALARYARAGRPQQKWDEYTPDVWADALDDVRYEDAAAAVKHLVKSASYIDVESIRGHVGKVRADRINKAMAKRPPIPDEIGDNVYYETRWVRAWLTAVGDGAPIEEAADVESVRRVVEEARREVPRLEANAALAPEVHKPEVLRQVEVLRPGRSYIEAQKELKAQAAAEMERERRRQLRALEATMNASSDEAGAAWS